MAEKISVAYHMAASDHNNLDRGHNNLAVVVASGEISVCMVVVHSHDLDNRNALVASDVRLRHICRLWHLFSFKFQREKKEGGQI